jgi:hypothetical protein
MPTRAVANLRARCVQRHCPADFVDSPLTLLPAGMWVCRKGHAEGLLGPGLVALHQHAVSHQTYPAAFWRQARPASAHTSIPAPVCLSWVPPLIGRPWHHPHLLLPALPLACVPPAVGTASSARVACTPFVMLPGPHTPHHHCRCDACHTQPGLDVARDHHCMRAGCTGVLSGWALGVVCRCAATPWSSRRCAGGGTAPRCCSTPCSRCAAGRAATAAVTVAATSNSS